MWVSERGYAGAGCGSDGGREEMAQGHKIVWEAEGEGERAGGPEI